MLSERFYKLLNAILSVGLAVGASPLRFNTKTLQISCDSTCSAMKRLRINSNLQITWATLAFCLVIKQYVYGTFESYYVTLVHWIGGAVMMSIPFIIRWYSKDYCQAVNGMITYFRYLHRKLCFELYVHIPN